ncbi:MAG: DnaB-like helicase N-terminal domain-containing protein, partial [Verrucomicrobiia bacterium]
MPAKPASSDNLNAPVDLATAGRTLPHSLDAEKGLLAACLIDPAEVISRCMAQKLPNDAFYNPAHQTIYATCVEVYEDKSILDAKVLAE